MPRGIKKEINFNEEFEKIKARITYHSNSIKELKKKKLELEQKQQKEELNSVKNYLEKNHLSSKDLIEVYENQKAI